MRATVVAESVIIGVCVSGDSRCVRWLCAWLKPVHIKASCPLLLSSAAHAWRAFRVQGRETQ